MPVCYMVSIHPPTHTLTHSHTHTLTHSFTNPITHSPTHAPTHPPTHLPTHSPIHSPTHTHSPTHSPTHTLTPSLIHPHRHSPIHSLSHPLTHPQLEVVHPLGEFGQCEEHLPLLVGRVRHAVTSLPGAIWRITIVPYRQRELGSLCRLARQEPQHRLKQQEQECYH